jgi:hypothetical protein
MAKKFPKPSDAEVDSHTLDMFELEAQSLAQQAVEVSDAQKVDRAAEGVATEKRIAEAAKVVDIVARAKLIAHDVQFEDVVKKRMGDMFIAVPENTDTNKRIVLDYLFNDAESKPHVNEFIGRIVDHRGVIVDDFYSGKTFLDAYNAVGLRKLKLKEVIDAVRAYALDHRWNDLSKRVDSLIPKQWDGVPRMESALIRMFDSHDTAENRAFGLYFWTSLYCRMMHPGEEAPIVLTLIGVQNCGKSYFGKLLTRLLTGDKESDSTQLNLDGNRIDFLRDITGQSVVASIGEMAGFTRGDVNKIKDFVTRTHDKFHYKFEGVVHQARQWITIMDANRYEGLYRDETGNRRFYAQFCGQLPDVEGRQQWREDFKADFSTLPDDLWQLLAEARAWLANNGGLDGYRDMVRTVSKMVFEFSKSEAQNDRGTIKDDSVAPHIIAALKNAPCREILKRDGSGDCYVFYDRADLISAIVQAAAPLDPTREKRFLKDLEKACAMKGGGIPARRDCKTVPGFAFFDHQSKRELLAAIGADGERDEARLIAGTPAQPAGF